MFPLLDPMCGSGTFLIEAAMIARGMAPGALRKGFSFQKLKNFKPEIWSNVVQEVMDGESHSEAVSHLYGFDLSRKAIKDSLINATEAGVEEDIIFKRGEVSLLENPLHVGGEGGGGMGVDSVPESGIIIVNPPYGEKLGGAFDEVIDTYKDLGFALKKNFKGWACWILSGNSGSHKSSQNEGDGKVPCLQRSSRMSLSQI